MDSTWGIQNSQWHGHEMKEMKDEDREVGSWHGNKRVSAEGITAHQFSLCVSIATSNFTPSFSIVSRVSRFAWSFRYRVSIDIFFSSFWNGASSYLARWYSGLQQRRKPVYGLSSPSFLAFRPSVISTGQQWRNQPWLMYRTSWAIRSVHNSLVC